MTDPYDILLAVLGALLVIIGTALVVRRFFRQEPSVPYTRGPAFLDRGRSELRAALHQRLAPDFHLLTDVALTDLVHPLPDLPSRKQRHLRRAIEGRTVDFVLFRRDDLSVAGVLSFEGGSAGLDSFIEKVLDAAAIPVLDCSTKSPPSAEEIRGRLADLDRRFAPGYSAQDEWGLGSPQPVGEEGDDWFAGLGSSASPPVPPSPRPEQSEKDRTGSSPLLCPECGSDMIRRRMVRGPYAGREIWICTKFPSCRKTLPVLPE